MGFYSVTLNDVGEGVAEAELIEWHVAVGDFVLEDQLLGAVMTDKAAVDVPSSVMGKVVSLNADVGDIVAVGAELVRLEVEGEGNVTASADPGTSTTNTSKPVDTNPVEKDTQQNNDDNEAAEAIPQTSSSGHTGTLALSKPLAAPSVRKRAMDANIELASISGSGPAGRITHSDVDQFLQKKPATAVINAREANTSVEETKLVGIRRKIASKMSESKSRIPHITIVEEVDVSNLEELRNDLNETHAQSRVKLTVLPFVMKAIVEAVREQPDINSRFEDDEGIVYRHGGVNIGIATQTPNGLVVPVARHCECNNLWDNATDVKRLAEACRESTISREDMVDSTISITSLGPLGAIATTPIINYPEVAIVGLNKIAIRPHWDGQQFVPRKMMNISCSFDHRIIDGWDAAVFVRKIKTLLEQPAMLFVET